MPKENLGELEELTPEKVAFIENRLHEHGQADLTGEELEIVRKIKRQRMHAMREHLERRQSKLNIDKEMLRMEELTPENTIELELSPGGSNG